jgi:hypothetical protein
MPTLPIPDADRVVRIYQARADRASASGGNTSRRSHSIAAAATFGSSRRPRAPHGAQYPREAAPNQDAPESVH